MTTYSDKETALNKINEAVNDGGESISVTIGRSERMETLNPFVLLFYDSLLDIIKEFGLCFVEVKALLRILHYMEYGNLVSLSFAQIMRDIDADVTNASKVVKKLRDAGILIKKDGHMFLNPHIVAKGKFKRRDQEAVELLEFSAEELEKRGMLPSILTPGLKTKLAACQSQK